jgi:hypothetical protein
VFFERYTRVLMEASPEFPTFHRITWWNVASLIESLLR